MDKKSSSHHIVMVNFNAKNGVRNINDNMECSGPFGLGNINERKERLLDFGEKNNLVVTNSFFLKAANRYWTWEAPGVTESQNDFILSSDWKTVRNCEVITKVDTGSDHRMVRPRIEIDKKLMRLKKKKKKKKKIKNKNHTE